MTRTMPWVCAGSSVRIEHEYPQELFFSFEQCPQYRLLKLGRTLDHLKCTDCSFMLTLTTSRIFLNRLLQQKYEFSTPDTHQGTQFHLGVRPPKTRGNKLSCSRCALNQSMCDEWFQSFAVTLHLHFTGARPRLSSLCLGQRAHAKLCPY